MNSSHHSARKPPRAPFSPHDSILVIGDLILDEYLIGQATRLSREAAVPVLERTRRELVPGGAANPAVGIVALGGRATMVGVVGDDKAADEIRRLLEARGVATDGVMTDASRPTTLKTRIIAEGGFIYGQHLARIDYLDRRPLDEIIAQKLVEKIKNILHLGAHQLLLVSDYKNGMMTPSLIRALRMIGMPLVVDSQGDLERFEGFDLVKCNRAEAEQFLGMSIKAGDAQARRTVLEKLQKKTSARAVVVTLGGEGMAWQDETGYGESHALRAEVYDVTGAGDTVIAVLALAQAVGLPLSQACHIASHAAALTVRVMGNYAPTWQEIEKSLG